MEPIWATVFFNASWRKYGQLLFRSIRFFIVNTLVKMVSKIKETEPKLIEFPVKISEDKVVHKKNAIQYRKKPREIL